MYAKDQRQANIDGSDRLENVEEFKFNGTIKLQ